jgi:lactoylglutathione lyase
MGTVINDVRTVGVPVTDQDRAVDFYVGVLGLEKRLDVPVQWLGGRWIEVAPRGAQTTIALIPARPGTATGVETQIRLATADAGALRDELRERGVTVGELLRWVGAPPMFTLRDPDNNGLEVTQS